MNKLLVQLVLIISSVILVTACTGGGSLPAEEESDPFFDALPTGLPVFSEINEPYLNTSKQGDSLSLFSYKTAQSGDEASVETEIFSSSTNIIVSLNTVADQFGSTEFTLIVKSDSVYLVNHDSNQIRLLSHFVNKVCEIIPTETVSEELEILHDELVYVMTADSSSLDDDCLSDSKKRFYALPLDHQLDPSLDADGELESLSLVKESKARAKLIFGWEQDPSNPSQDIMTYGYLGYAVEQKELSLFDENGDLVWTQDRELQRFEQVAIAPETLSEKYLFHIQALENQQYLIQLGLDVFVVDSSTELLQKTFNETDTILTDKTMSVELSVKSSDTNDDVLYVLPVKAFYDDDDLLLVDNNKIYRLNYQANIPTRNSVISIPKQQNPVNINDKKHLSNIGFSQFDLKACEADDFACEAALDVEAQSWQFLVRCEDQTSCTVPASTADFCETREEKLQSQSDELLCTASNYEHLVELNHSDNDAELLAYMQYVEDYARHLEFILHNDRLFITAQMNHKDLFLAYDYNQDFSAPKALREQVFFGERASLTGIDAYFSDDNLFLTVLQKGALRSNECYKQGRKVPCNLSVLNDSGGASACTGKDLEEKLCTNQFNEYESKSIFCTANQIADLSCSDSALSQLDSLAVESADQDAKWLSLYDYATNKQRIYLLVGDHALALQTGNLDEGKLYMPSLYSVDSSTGQIESTQLTSLDGAIERVLDGWLYKERSLGIAEVFGRINLIKEEINQDLDVRTTVQSTLSTYILEQTFANQLSTEPSVVKAPKVAERLFEKL